MTKSAAPRNKSSAAPAHTPLSGEDWLNRINGPHTKLRYIRCDEGIWEVTTPEFGEMLEIYAKENAKAAHQALYEALSAARDGLLAVRQYVLPHLPQQLSQMRDFHEEIDKATAALAMADAAKGGSNG